jgi:long-subunit acyl-CoA synthetase (AMP-forming)
MQVKIAEDGEILVKGTSVFKGYYMDEEKTKKLLPKTDTLKPVILDLLTMKDS